MFLQSNNDNEQEKSKKLEAAFNTILLEELERERFDKNIWRFLFIVLLIADILRLILD